VTTIFFIRCETDRNLLLGGGSHQGMRVHPKDEFVVLKVGARAFRVALFFSTLPKKNEYQKWNLILPFYD
jgi:hypothetical protein